MQPTTPPDSPLSEKPRRPWNPSRLFSDYAFAARAWALLAIGAVMLTVIQPYLIVSACRTRERVVVLDGGGTFSVSPLLGFEEARTLHETIAVWATLALTQRNPANFDFPDLLQRLFLTDACARAQAQLLATREEFEVKQIHQKPEIFKIDILRTRQEQVIVKVEGQLVRTGVFEKQIFSDTAIP